MNILFPQTGNPYLIDKVYLGYSLDILEYLTTDAKSRTHHLPKGHIWAAQLDFRHSSIYIKKKFFEAKMKKFSKLK